MSTETLSRALDIVNPGTGELGRVRPERDAGGRGPRGAGRARGAAGLGPARLRRPRQGPARDARRPSRRTSTSSCRSSSPSRARRSARPRSSCTRPRTRSSTTPGCRARCARSRIHNVDTGVDARVLRRPLGVVAAIVPWNFPTTLLCNKLGPALPVRATPSWPSPPTRRRSPRCGWPRSSTRPGCPKASSTCCRAPARWPVRRSSRTRCVRKVAFTGSTPVGERVHALAADGSKRVTLELGGSDPMIICDDADLKSAASAAAMGRFYNCGQACLAIKRLYVFESRRRRDHRGRRGQGQAAARWALAMTRTASWARCTPSASGRSVERQIAESGRRDRRRRRAAGRAWTPAGSTSRPSSSSPASDSPMALEEVFGPALPIWRVRGPRRGDRAGQRLAVRPRVERVDERPQPRRARRRRARLRLHVDQLAHEGLRRAAVRRPEGLGLRQGARLRGARLLHRPEVGRASSGRCRLHVRLRRFVRRRRER